MKLNNKKMIKRTLLSAIASMVITNSAMAHDTYIWPSYFNINADKPTHVAVDLTVSNTAFRPEFSVPSHGVKVLGVNGEPVRRLGPYYQGQKRSSFDLSIDGPGTYGLFYQKEPRYFTRYTLDNVKKSKRLMANKQEAVALLPKNAKEIKTAKYSTIAMSFVTNKAPTNEVLAPKNKGFELITLTHPSDYITGESIELKALYNGKPVENVQMVVELEGTQYRKSPQAIEVTTNHNGKGEFIVQKGGRYLLKTKHEAPSSNDLADVDVTRIFYAFEVIFE
jgi:uncharacterized GH25 family protein